ncbi:hypothetical protein [Clostridium perfringens]|uniref:hypothetical protein n=1 Tax=Clostridium perfringens TaxID=1502 RepID=UPI003A0FE2ED
MVTEENQSEVSYDVIKEILKRFGRIMSNYTSKEKQKMLLHMLVLEITIGKDREIDSIKLKINDGLIDYLSNEEEVL